jgi:hypothetical protein
MPEPITPTEYRGFQKAYDFFNVELFGGTLPHVLVTLQRHAKAKGYFSPHRFTGRIQAKRTAHERVSGRGATGGPFGPTLLKIHITALALFLRSRVHRSRPLA